jgi:hypothetical protein
MTGAKYRDTLALDIIMIQSSRNTETYAEKPIVVAVQVAVTCKGVEESRWERQLKRVQYTDSIFNAKLSSRESSSKGAQCISRTERKPLPRVNDEARTALLL